jgi:hypothetical protein
MAQERRRVLILQPTIELIERTIERELRTRPNAPTHYVFHGGTVHNRSVAAELSDFSRGADIDGSLVFATHQVLPHIPFLAEKHLWDVLVDEELQSHQCHSHDIPETHHLITDYLELEPFNSIYSRVKVKDVGEAKKMAKNVRGDELLETFRGVAQLLTNRHWDSFVNAQTYNDLINGRRSALTIHSVLRPSVLEGFNSVTMASAKFRDTMIYQLWSRDEVKFKENTDIANLLRFREHNNGSLITIKYADEKKWSRKRRTGRLNPDSKDPATIQDEIVRATIAALGESPFIWQANKDVTDAIFEGEGERLPKPPGDATGGAGAPSRDCWALCRDHWRHWPRDGIAEQPHQICLDDRLGDHGSCWARGCLRIRRL